MNERAYEKMLLAIDFAPETEPVIERAQQLKEQCQARLILLHVVEYLPMSYSGDLVLPDDFDLEKELLDVATKQMAVLGDRLGVPTDDRLVELGTTGRTILRLTADLDVDLVILGSHGRHGLAVLLGSTARTVLNGATCDVLAVRTKESS